MLLASLLIKSYIQSTILSITFSSLSIYFISVLSICFLCFCKASFFFTFCCNFLF